ncbi:hypothetical protein BC830DRAFT_448392 [Chytriomyces sp. MP71]|nr:hypothetical protein BC830DRAFT_448392 [Chytriomyces sp. MP71]
MSLARVWNFVPPGKTEYFAAARDWSRKWPHYGFINVGLMLLTPFMHHFDELLKLALMHPYNVYYEQTLISKYFHEDRKDLFFEQPKSLNVMFLSQRNKKEPESVIGYHQEVKYAKSSQCLISKTSSSGIRRKSLAMLTEQAETFITLNCGRQQCKDSITTNFPSICMRTSL